MNEIVTKKRDETLPFDLIHQSMAKEFRTDAKAMYEAESRHYDVFRLPTTLLDGDGEFYEAVVDLYNFSIESLMREDFPEVRWDNFTSEEYEDYEEMIGYHPFTLEDLFLSDLKLALNSYDLFYLEIETSYCPKTRQCVEDVIEIWNSPLKEVW